MLTDNQIYEQELRCFGFLNLAIKEYQEYFIKEFGEDGIGNSILHVALIDAMGANMVFSGVPFERSEEYADQTRLDILDKYQDFINFRNPKPKLTVVK